jgi:esterase/lipase superfamily enzyme
MANNPRKSQQTKSQALSASPSFNNSYIITNRAYPYTLFPDSTDYVVPLPSGALYFSTSPYPYDSYSIDYTSVTSDSSAFLSALTTDLSATVDKNGHANLAVYIHGLGNTYDDAITATADFGTALAQLGNYNGLVIGFSWPSYSQVVAGFPGYYATSYPPQNISGTIRDNINGSIKSFVAMIQLLLKLGTKTQPLNLSLMTHSEGNFMLMLGMQALKKTGCTGSIKNAVMMAADISAAMLQQGQYGQAITDCCDQVNVYYSGCDDVLGYSDYYFVNFHAPLYPTRLGLIGPYAYPPAKPVPANVSGIDCSQVTVNLGLITNVHSCYMSVSQIVADISSTLMSSSNPGRILYPGSANPSYYLDPSTNQASAQVLRPGMYQRSRPRVMGRTF